MLSGSKVGGLGPIGFVVAVVMRLVISLTDVLPDADHLIYDSCGSRDHLTVKFLLKRSDGIVSMG